MSMDRFPSRTIMRVALLLGVPLGMFAGPSALSWAQSGLHVFEAEEVLTEQTLNGNFKLLSDRIQALEAQLAQVKATDPLSGTYPAVVGWGGIESSQSTYRGITFCGTPPETIHVEPLPAQVASNAFGPLLFSNGGALNTRLGEAGDDNPCPATTNLCAAPLTFFLKSAGERTLDLDVYLDDAGAYYVNGKRVKQLGANRQSISIDIPKGPFSLTFMSCSINGRSLTLDVYDQFIRAEDSGLSVDYDRTFHRNGQ